MRPFPAIFLSLVAAWVASAQTYTISTFAGGGLPVNIPGTSASLYGPLGVAADSTGNILFADGANILRLDAKTGLITLVAGNGIAGCGGDNGPATSGQLSDPWAVAVGSSGTIYIADYLCNRIRKVANGVITTVAGGGASLGDNGPATSAQLQGPAAVAVDSSGNLYIADSQNNRVRKVSNGVITTVAGNGGSGFAGDNGPAASAILTTPQGVAVDSAGNLFIADSGNNRIRKVSNGVITSMAGGGPSLGDNGQATSAQLSFPWSVTLDSVGNLYFMDFNDSRVRKISTNGVITTVAGDGFTGFSGDNGPATSAELLGPGVAVDSSGNLYIADAGNRRIREVSNGEITSVAGNGTNGSSGDNGPAVDAELNIPEGVAVDSSGNVYFADSGAGRVRKVSNGIITTVAGIGIPGFSGDNGPAIDAELNGARALAVDGSGNLYIADGNRVRKVSNGVITTVAGNGSGGFSGDGGPATSAQIFDATGVAVDFAGNLYIADSGNNRIREVSNGVITTVAGTGTTGVYGGNGPAIDAELSGPMGVAVDSSGNLYICDTGNKRLVEVSNGTITTVAGSGTLDFPLGVAAGSGGNLYITDAGTFRILKSSNGVTGPIAGGGTLYVDDIPASSAALSPLGAVAADSSGNVYFADGSNRIRVLTPGTPPRIAPNGIVPVDSAVPVVQPGSWVSVYGGDLASGTSSWSGDFPISLGGANVMIDNKPSYLWFVSPTQINAQVPDDATTGMVSVVVTTGSGTATSTVTLAPYGPSFSLLGDAKHVAGEILTPNGTGAYGSYDLVGPSNTFSYSTRPVKAGETLVLFGVGFGPTTLHVSAGQAFSGSAPTSTPVTITIGGVNANVSYSGITEAGLYQFNLTVPANTGSGDQPVQATVNGIQTPLGPVVTVQ